MIPSPLFPLRGMCPSCLVIRPSKWIIPPAPGGQILFMPLSLWIHLVETTGGVTVASKSKWGDFWVSRCYPPHIACIHFYEYCRHCRSRVSIKKKEANSVYPKDFPEAPLLTCVIISAYLHLVPVNLSGVYVKVGA